MWEDILKVCTAFEVNSESRTLLSIPSEMWLHEALTGKPRLSREPERPKKIDITT